MLKLVTVFLCVFAGGNSLMAQGRTPLPMKQHPTASDVAAIFAEMTKTLNNIEEPASQLATSEWSFAQAQGLHTRIESLKSLLKTWTLILQTSKEKPYASDLFTIYVEFRNVQDSCEGLLASGIAGGPSAEDVKRATVLGRDLTTSMTLYTDLEPAVFDAISELEKEAHHGPKIPGEDSSKRQ